jgi:hypothetical protein
MVTGAATAGLEGDPAAGSGNGIGRESRVRESRLSSFFRGLAKRYGHSDDAVTSERGWVDSGGPRILWRSWVPPAPHRFPRIVHGLGDSGR